MSGKEGFSGFPKEGLGFLTELASNNNREWFQEHKNEYLTHLMEPGKMLVEDLGEKLRTLSPEIVSDTRTNGSGTIMRIHRDIRFSKDKTPYNTQMRFIFWEGKGKKMENPGFYFCHNGKEGQIYAGQYVFPKPKLEGFRDAVMDEELGPELEGILESFTHMEGYFVEGDQYKRVPRDYDDLHDRAYLLKYKGMYAGGPVLTKKQLASPDLVDILFDHCRIMAPLHHWLVKVDEKLR